MTPEELKKQADEIKEADKLAWMDDRPRAALKAYRLVLQSNPGNALAHWRIGQIHFFAEERNLEGALNEFRQAIDISPDWSEGHLCCANTLKAMNRLDDAIAEYREAIRLHPSDARYHISLGDCLARLGAYGDAVLSFRKGIELQPSYGEIDARMMLADALRNDGRVQDAINEWRIVAGMKAVWDYEKGKPERAKSLIAEYEVRL
jgi:tetratricopeptide (TPR) repeat protein